ncbi:MAG: hypothetical protein K2Q21_01750 [Chitinophagaceae bacterium]|nr:hypothetical protein [Chitinophagaceae bacterium]
MKKIIQMQKTLALIVLVLGCTFNVLMAQPPGGGQPAMDPAQMLSMMKERVKPKLIEKTKLTDLQADKVLEIRVASMAQMRGLRDLSEEERTAKMKKLREENNEKYKTIPLTEDQIKAVNDFWDEMRKNQMQRGAGNN